MLDLTAALALWFPSILGLGCALSRFVLGLPTQPRSVGQLGVLGFAMLCFLGIVIHFLFPLGPYVSLVVWVSGMGAGVWLRADMPRLRSSMVALSVLVPALILVALRTPYPFDTGYYHLPSIELIRTYAISPGAGNILGPFGHSTVWFIVASLLWLPGLPVAAAFSANTLFISFSMLAFFELALAGHQQGGAVRSAPLFALGVLLLSRTFASTCGGLGPDGVAALLILLTLTHLTEVLETSDEAQATRAMRLAWLFAIFGALVKLSAVLGPLFVLSVSFFRTWSPRTALGRMLDLVVRSRVGRFNLLLVSLWIGRGLIISGCAAFPQNHSCVGVPWAVPVKTVKFWAKDILYHAEPAVPRGGYQFSLSYWGDWFGQALRTNSSLRLVFYGSVFAFVFAGLGLSLRRFRKKRALESPVRLRTVAFLLGASIAGIAFSLSMAPVARFAMPFFSALLLASFLFVAFSWSWVGNLSSWGCWAIFLVALTLDIRTMLITQPNPLLLRGWPRLPWVDSKAVTMRSQVSVVAPVSGIQCWTLPPPCLAVETPAVVELLAGPRLYVLPGPTPYLPWHPKNDD